MAVLSALVLYNPTAGRAKLRVPQLKSVLERLRKQGIETDVQKITPGAQLPGKLRLAGKDLMIVWGGDGTIHSVLPDLVEAQVPLAILPAGTANVMARELNLPLDIDAAIDVLRTGIKRRVFLGTANGRYFHLMAGIGADGYVISRVNSLVKGLLGVGAYWLVGLYSFWRYPLEPFRVRVDGQEYEATFAVISNARFYGAHLLVAPKASVFEDALDVCLFTSTRHLRFLKYLWGSLRGRHMGYSDVIYRKARRVEARGASEIPVQMDGEPAGTLPREFGVSRQTLEVFVPCQNQKVAPVRAA
jgi:YegS/Rv2252/BmrU family lipid kinase